MDLSEPVQSISSLIEKLSKATKAEYAILLRHLDVDIDEVSAFAHFCEDGYVRHCFEQNDDWELLMLCWDEGQETPVHAHGGQECWVKILDGQIEETLYKRSSDEEMLTKISNKMRLPGDLSYMNDQIGLHTLGSPKGQSLSLHLYAKPIEMCKIYDDNGALLEVKEMEPDSVGI